MNKNYVIALVVASFVLFLVFPWNSRLGHHLCACDTAPPREAAGTNTLASVQQQLTQQQQKLAILQHDVDKIDQRPPPSPLQIQVQQPPPQQQQHVTNSLQIEPTKDGILHLQKWFHAALLYDAQHSPTDARVEGHTGECPEESANYLKFTAERNPGVLCEIGFNAGHSAITFLMAAPKTKYYAFDLGNHGYSALNFNKLKEIFADRMTITWGDSTKTVPAYHAAHPEFTCDLVHVDGDHYGTVPYIDLLNFYAMAHKDTLVVLDDTTAAPDVAAGWRRMINEGKIKQLGCTDVCGGRGYCYGTYVK